jgi:RimJ/RimL family protein N-acetyltransferase
MSAAQDLQNDLVILEPASEANVDLLVRWTLDPVAQGPYKRVPETSAAQLRDLFLHEQSREYFVIRVVPDGTPVGRLYWRAWRFTPDPDAIDWELNIFLAEPCVRGRGLGSSSQGLAVQYLLGRQSTRSVFAYTAAENHAERRALQKAGLHELGALPHQRYPVPFPEGEWRVYSTCTQADIGPACQRGTHENSR